MIQSLYKAGLPEGNIFDFAASRISKFEHKWNTEQRKKAYIEKYKHMGTGKDLPNEKSAFGERPTSAKSNKSAKSAKSNKKEPEKVVYHHDRKNRRREEKTKKTTNLQPKEKRKKPKSRSLLPRRRSN